MIPLIACVALWLVGTRWSNALGKKRFAQLSMIAGLAWLLGYAGPAVVACTAGKYTWGQVEEEACDLRSAHAEENAELERLCEPQKGARHDMIRGFESSPQQYLYPWLFLTLGGLLFALQHVPNSQRERASSPFGHKALEQAAPLALVVFASTRWTHYQRISSTHWATRRIFSYVHYDISPASALLNDLLFLVFAYLLALVCLDARERALSMSRIASEALSMESRTQPSDLKRAYRNVVESYSYWKVASLGLALAFSYHSYVYWEIIQKMGDTRYRVSAILTHALWAACWAVVSMPLVHAWRAWKRQRDNLLFYPPADQAGAYSLPDIKPIDTWSFLAAATAGLATFLMPPLQKTLESILIRVDAAPVQSSVEASALPAKETK